jgi:glyoxylase-like metal-dependent hydrolase (beta-lactamase superfamily II)
MNIHTFQVNPFQENTYLVSQNGRAIVVDPGFYNASEINIFLQALEQENAKLEAIVLTHAHLDHVFGVDKVRNRFDIPVYLHKEDLYFWENYMLSAARFGFDVKPFDFVPENMSPTTDYEIAGMHFDVRFTPGHAPGHVSLYSKEHALVISGDVLFRESVGRTDLYKGDFDVLENSIRTQLYTLPDETKVYSGHGPETTIGHEKRHNPYVRE